MVEAQTEPDAEHQTQSRMLILIDTREQRPYPFGDCPTQRVALETGDYSCVCDGRDLREAVAIERKSVSDLLGCIGGQRERFERELARLAEIPFQALVIERSMPDLIEAARESKLHPRAVMGSVLAWTFKYGIAPIWCSGRPYAAAAVRTLLMHAARYSAAAQAPPPSMVEKSLMHELRSLRAALCEIADVLDRSHDSHPQDDGFSAPQAFHLEHARQHLELLAAGDSSEDHLSHAAARLLFALEVRSRE